MVKRIMTMEGRATRLEFWMVHLISYLILVAGIVLLSIPQVKIPLYEINPQLALGLFVALFCVCVATQILVGIRRIHDLNTGGWAYGITLIPVVGFAIYFLSAGFLRSHPEDNRYGPSPVR
ncbi:DUF805 domain-containing protein [Kiloniella sp.]|uniref:DUF805 domain-containing protein n=1 Tax=Kiloniella sp. TaxID=1938587 RepID=UPI003B027835